MKRQYAYLEIKNEKIDGVDQFHAACLTRQQSLFSSMVEQIKVLLEEMQNGTVQFNKNDFLQDKKNKNNG